ncbi:MULTISPECIES: hypothetical protein [Rhodococcus]|uniref:hypothetical protein n=1 Tax=Rhodococcus TaxID=1827 RepID=UPI0007CD7719|nr:MULTISPECIES: hypothetical protein [Rhodococcus]QXU56720.1 hypothetical protein KXC42_26260 [Rhodococcus sp. LW-XY12]
MSADLAALSAFPPLGAEKAGSSFFAEPAGLVGFFGFAAFLRCGFFVFGCAAFSLGVQVVVLGRGGSARIMR